MKKIFLLLPLLIPLLSIVLFNCKHEIPGKIVSPVRLTVSDTCSLDTIYFVNDILPIILSNCTQSTCHDAVSREDDVQLTDYDNIVRTGDVRAGRPDNSKLYEVLLESDPKKIMPPPPATMTPEQKNAIRIWILQGAKNNKCQNTCDTTKVTFSKNIWPILETTCKGCHNGPSGNGGISIQNYTQVKVLVDNGKLDGVINHRSGFKPMPPPPGALTNCAKDQIRVWINAGAPNN